MFRNYRKNKLARTARKHKTQARRKGVYYCVECKSKSDQQSDHILSQHYYPKLRYKLWNRCIRCQSCNRRKKDLFYWEFRSFVVLFKLCTREALVALTLVAIGVYCYENYSVLSDLISNVWLYCHSFL